MCDTNDVLDFSSADVFFRYLVEEFCCQPLRSLLFGELAFAVASFHVGQDRIEDADDILEDILPRHIEKFGLESRRAQQTTLKIVELLNGWGRETDPLAFLGRHKALLQEDPNASQPTAKTEKKTRSETDQESYDQRKPTA